MILYKLGPTGPPGTGPTGPTGPPGTGPPGNRRMFLFKLSLSTSSLTYLVYFLSLSHFYKTMTKHLFYFSTFFCMFVCDLVVFVGVKLSIITAQAHFLIFLTFKPRNLFVSLLNLIFNLCFDLSVYFSSKLFNTFTFA